MNFRKANSRTRYASVLYAAALAALLSGCSKTDVAIEAAPNAASIHLSEGASTAVNSVRASQEIVRLYRKSL